MLPEDVHSVLSENWIDAISQFYSSRMSLSIDFDIAINEWPGRQGLSADTLNDIFSSLESSGAASNNAASVSLAPMLRSVARK